MKSKLVRIVSVIGLAMAIATGYVALQRATVNVPVNDANDAIVIAVTRSKSAVAKSKYLRELTTEVNVTTNRQVIIDAA